MKPSRRLLGALAVPLLASLVILALAIPAWQMLPAGLALSVVILASIERRWPYLLPLRLWERPYSDTRRRPPAALALESPWWVLVDSHEAPAWEARRTQLLDLLSARPPGASWVLHTLDPELARRDTNEAALSLVRHLRPRPGIGDGIGALLRLCDKAPPDTTLVALLPVDESRRQGLERIDYRRRGLQLALLDSRCLPPAPCEATTSWSEAQACALAWRQEIHDTRLAARLARQGIIWL